MAVMEAPEFDRSAVEAERIGELSDAELAGRLESLALAPRSWTRPAREAIMAESARRLRKSAQRIVDGAAQHPTRLRILLELRDGECSPKQVSDATGITLGSVAYHVRVLAVKGLIRVAREARVRGAVEHFYVLTARGRRELERLGRG